MELISIEGIVISSLKYGESSKVLNILTKEKGIIGVISKGALKEKSKLRSVSDNFTYAIFHMYYKEGKLSTLVSADVINYFINIRSDIEKLGTINYLTELTKEVYKSNSNSHIYELFISSLFKIEEGLNPKVLSNILEVKYLDYLGIGLCLDGCVVCGSTSVVSLSHSKGGYVCYKDRTSEPLYDEAFLKLIKVYYYIDISKISVLNLKEKTINEIDTFLSIYYKDYSGLYLRSKEFVNKLNNL